MNATQRDGTTLTELLIAMTLALAVGGISTVALSRYQKLTTYLTVSTATREQLRDAVDILSTDLRAIAPASSEILFASDTALEFFSTIGASTICTSPTNREISLPPDSLASGNVLTSWLITPDSNDIVSVFADSGDYNTVPQWIQQRIVSLSTTSLTTACPPASGFTSSADIAANLRAHVVTLVDPLPLGVPQGSPIRFLRRARYSIYRASDKQWYLGYRRCSPTNGTCDIVQPISGPYTSDALPPLTFTYYTPNGQIPPPNSASTDISSIRITIRSTPKRILQIFGFSTRHDSLQTTVTLRNR